MRDKIRSLASDTAIYGVFTVIGRILNYLLTPVYSNYLNSGEIAFMVYLYSIIAFVNIFYTFGMETAFFRFFAGGDARRSKQVFSLSYLFIVMVSLIFTILIELFAVPIAHYMTDLPEGPTMVRLAAVIPLLDAMIIIPYGQLRMKRQARKFAMTKFLLIIVNVAVVMFLVVGLKMGLNGVIIAGLIASGFGVIMFIKMIFQSLDFKLDAKLFSEMFRFGLPTLPASVSAIILQVADRPILSELTKNDMSVATYGIVYRLGIPMMIFVSVFEYAWKPFYLSNFENNDAKQTYSRVLTYFTLIASVIFLLVSLFVDFLVRVPFIGGRFINPIYWQGLFIVPIILAGYYFNGVYTNISAGFLIQKKTNLLPISIVTAAVVNIGMNLWLIPIMGYAGAAWATLGAYFVSAALLYAMSRKIYPINYEWGRIGKIILLCAGVFTAYKLVNFSSMWSNFIYAIVLMIVYAGLLKVTGFFTHSELNQMKRVFRRKK